MSTTTPTQLPEPLKRIDPRAPEVAAVLSAIEQARPVPVTRGWIGTGRRRKTTLEQVHSFDGGHFLHLPWLREPRPHTSSALWFALGLAFAIVVFVGTGYLQSLVFFGPQTGWVLIRSGVLAFLVFSATVGVGFQRRHAQSTRPVETDNAGGLPGLICLDDRLLIRYPDALYSLPRAALAGFVQRDHGEAQGVEALIEHQLIALLDRGKAAPQELMLATFVAVLGAAEDDEHPDRAAVLMALSSWLEQHWRRAGSRRGAPHRRPG